MDFIDYLTLAALVLGTAFSILVLLNLRRQQAVQDEIVATLSGHPYWRIGIARPDRMARLFTLIPFQAVGVLVDEGSSVRVRARWNGSREALEFVLPKDRAHHPRWIEHQPLRGGNLSWAEIASPNGPLMITSSSRQNALVGGRALTDILRSAFPEIQLPAAAMREFALEKNRASVLAMVAMFALGFYAMLDTYVFSRYELIDSQILQIALKPATLVSAGLLLLAAGGIVFGLMRRAQVPPVESSGLAVLVTAALALALPPVLKRVDQALAPAASASYRYRVTDRAITLQPVDRTLGLPVLLFKRAPEYWAQFPTGSEVEIPLLHGGLGLWQLDHEVFDPPVMAFYEKNP